MVRKGKAILNIFKDKKADYLDPRTILVALDQRGFKMSKRELSNFIRNSLENKYLISTRDSKGVIKGWNLVRII